jgi:hypothetical protein
MVKKGANCSKRELTLRMADTSRNEKWKKECCCAAADIKGTSVIVDLSAMSLFYDKLKGIANKMMKLFTATAQAPVMTILIEVMAGDIKVDLLSRGENFLMPLAVTGMPPSRDRPVHSIAAHQGENSHTR